MNLKKKSRGGLSRRGASGLALSGWVLVWRAAAPPPPCPPGAPCTGGPPGPPPPGPPPGNVHPGPPGQPPGAWTPVARDFHGGRPPGDPGWRGQPPPWGQGPAPWGFGTASAGRRGRGRSRRRGHLRRRRSTTSASRSPRCGIPVSTSGVSGSSESGSRCSAGRPDEGLCGTFHPSNALRRGQRRVMLRPWISYGMPPCAPIQLAGELTESRRWSPEKRRRAVDQPPVIGIALKDAASQRNSRPRRRPH